MNEKEGFWTVKVSKLSLHGSEESFKNQVIRNALLFWNQLLPGPPPRNLTYEEAINFFDMDPLTISLEITDEVEKQNKEREQLPVVYLLTIFADEKKSHTCYRHRFQAEQAVANYGSAHWEEILGVPAPELSSAQDRMDFQKSALQLVKHKITEIKVQG